MRASSTELLALEAELDASRQRARVAEDAARPRVDLWASLGARSAPTR